ncbi:MAG: glycosyltransferase family 2 protein [Schleiferiaceae bacterium]|nr:glycosyltransferase family 2 protein [Schleiferiaceae bacterium]MDG1219919.1 glycosyltransferase family 2 protein [Schleiferiaceae bacterium]MDG2225339.1 glycosyltransferase family 2 protein [Schleiferiaceae bacterium]MDO7566482.1 glycosyltransferase family 2 protein [Schleiferiaceae bacterium]MDO7583180.1 glycosyltransferase family 2 protein [Schleiferiaceae bacterium]
MKLTLLIPTYNEADMLERCIVSAKGVFDEVLVVDSFSTDETVNIAKKLGASVIQRAYENSASQKNWAIPQASYSWVLLLDADEWMTKPLREEVLRIKQGPLPRHKGFWVYRSNHFMGKRVRFSGLQGDKVIRLFDRDHCRYEDKHVHSEIRSSGSIGSLKHRLQHETFKSLAQWEQKLHRYAQWQAEDYDSKTGPITAYHTHIKPAWRFLKHFLLQRGFLDGAIGLQVSRYAAWGVRLRYSKLKALRAANGRG